MLLSLLLILHFGVAAAVVAGMGWLALIPWHRARVAHWTVRARLLWPARVANGLVFISVPTSLVAAQLWLFPEFSLADHCYAALAGFSGAILGGWQMAHAIFPDVPFISWLRDLAATLVVRMMTLGVLIVAAVCMPSHLDRATMMITVMAVAFNLWLIFGGMLWILRATGILVPAPERLTRIVSEVAIRMKWPMPRIGLLRTYKANAVAYPFLQTLLVTERALKTLPDEELGAICAHEFAHLNEPKRVILTRLFAAFIPLPVIFFKPAVEAGGRIGWDIILVTIVILSRSAKAFRNRMERRADSLATVHEGVSSGSYARALERLYEINQIPAVLAGKRTHPDLYDRLLASGVTPAYPRPTAPPRFTWQSGVAILLLVASIFAVVTTRRDSERQRPITVNRRG